VKLLFALGIAAVLITLLGKPKTRRVLRERIARWCAPLAVRVLGPLSPKAIVTALVRAAKAHTTDTHTGSFLPNHIYVGVSPTEYESWGPLALDVARDGERALRGVVGSEDMFVLLGRPKVTVEPDPLARPRRPRFLMSVLDADTVDGTTHRPSRSGPADATPIMPRRQAAAVDITGPLAEFEVLIDGVVVNTVELGEGRHTVGRDGACGLAIADQSVSRRHAILRVTRQFTTVQDAGSRNGVYLGQAKAEVPLLLSDGDRVTLSGTVDLLVRRCGARRKAS
jgi:hypothetical protein